MDKRQRETGFLSALVYFGQGAVGIAGIALPLHLRSLNWSIQEITAVTSIVSLPWVLKIVYGYLSDTFPLYGYRRKSYLLLCCFIAAAGWLCLSISGGQKLFIIGALLLGNLGFAATDVITDGLIVENSTRQTSPIFQSIAWGARSLGALISGVVGGWLAKNWDPYQVYMLTATLPLLVLIPVAFIEETRLNERVFKSFLDPVKRCFKLAITTELRWFLLLLIFFSSAASFNVPFFFHLKEQLQFEETFLGALVSLGQGGALVGSLVYATLLKQVNPSKVLKFAIVISVINILATLLIQDKTSALVLVFSGGVMGYLAILPLMSAAALLTHDSSVEGMMFAVLMGIYNLGQILFGMLGGILFKYIGLQNLIFVTALFLALGYLAANKICFPKIIKPEVSSEPS